jgi:hypothetical protein
VIDTHCAAHNDKQIAPLIALVKNDIAAAVGALAEILRKLSQQCLIQIAKKGCFLQKGNNRWCNGWKCSVWHEVPLTNVDCHINNCPLADSKKFSM